MEIITCVLLSSLLSIMSDLSQALQHGAPSAANKNKIVIAKKTLNNCIRKLPKKILKSSTRNQVLKRISSRVRSNNHFRLEDVTAESSTRYMLGSNSMLNENSVVLELLTPYGLNDDLADSADEGCL